MTAPRHRRLAVTIARDLGVGSAPEGSLDRLADRIAEYEQTVLADAVVYLHADRLTVEPTTFSEDAHLRPLLAEGEVALALRPFPASLRTDGAFVLYGSREQIRETLDSAATFAEEDA